MATVSLPAPHQPRVPARSPSSSSSASGHSPEHPQVQVPWGSPALWPCYQPRACTWPPSRGAWDPPHPLGGTSPPGPHPRAPPSAWKSSLQGLGGQKSAHLASDTLPPAGPGGAWSQQVPQVRLGRAGGGSISLGRRPRRESPRILGSQTASSLPPDLRQRARQEEGGTYLPEASGPRRRGAWLRASRRCRLDGLGTSAAWRRGREAGAGLLGRRDAGARLGSREEVAWALHPPWRSPSGLLMVVSGAAHS